MAKLKLVTIPHSVLTTPTKPVINIDSSIKQLVYDMEELLISQIDPQGVGLAATQVGKNLSLFIMKPSPQSETTVCINPKIVEITAMNSSSTDLSRSQPTSAKEETKLEGCLSIPRIWGPVHRPSKVKLTYTDLSGQSFTRWFTGFKATIVLHEMDHLQGILFTQRALEQKTPLYEEKNGELERMKY